MSVREAQDYAQGFSEISAQVRRPERRASAEDIKALDQLQAAARRGLAATMFREVTPVEGTKTNPELVGAYAVMAAIEKRLEADNARPAAQSIVMHRVLDSIAFSIEQGTKIEVNMKVQHERKLEPDKGGLRIRLVIWAKVACYE